MADQLFIRPKTEAIETDSQVDWFLYGQQGQLLDKDSCALSEIASTFPTNQSNFSVTLLAPTQSTLLTKVAIPATQVRQIQQALPFVVEELIAEDIESVHIATENKLDPRADHFDIAVIKHDVLIHWLDVLAHSALKVAAIRPEVHCLPYQANSMTILVDEQQLLLRWGDYAGNSVAVSHAHLLADLLRKEIETNAIRHIHLISCANSSTEVVDSLKQQLSQFELKESRYEESTAEFLAGKASQALPAFNLLQGGYAINQGRNHDQAGFKRIAYAAAAMLLVYLFAALGSGFYFQQRAEHVETQSTALYRELFPAERRVFNPRRQMQSHLGRGGQTANGPGFLPLLNNIAGSWNAGGNTPELNQLRYNAGRNQLQMELKTQSVAELDQLKQRLASTGVAVEINSANEQEDFVLGRISVGGQ